MKVIDIIKDTCTFLQMTDELEYLNTYVFETNSFGENENEEIIKNVNLLLKCVNLVINTICSEYVKLKDSTYIYTDTCKIDYSELSDNNITNIISVENDYKMVPFTDFGREICVERIGKYKVTYLYTLPDYDFGDDIAEIKLPTKDIAYGVAGEYLYINKLYDDAVVWDTRFKNSLLNLLSNRKHLYIRPRRWF